MSNKPQTLRIFTLRQPGVAFELRAWRPPFNVYETETGLVLVVDLVGVEPANLHLHVAPRRIQVHGTRQLAAPPGLRRVQHMEIGAGRFELDVPLATPIDTERSDAHYNQGLLEISLPFAPQG
ncbi:MAG: Hsp20/alpha crystallin family protein, partial [Chloroflexaceae bacterium]|nr:Hsp20/alpha crystallin family protein [Chloroflexaceae bacterium]